MSWWTLCLIDEYGNDVWLRKSDEDVRPFLRGLLEQGYKQEDILVFPPGTSVRTDELLQEQAS